MIKGRLSLALTKHMGSTPYSTGLYKLSPLMNTNGTWGAKGQTKLRKIFRLHSLQGLQLRNPIFPQSPQAVLLYLLCTGIKAWISWCEGIYMCVLCVHFIQYTAFVCRWALSRFLAWRILSVWLQPSRLRWRLSIYQCLLKSRTDTVHSDLREKHTIRHTEWAVKNADLLTPIFCLHCSLKIAHDWPCGTDISLRVKVIEF